MPVNEEFLAHLQNRYGDEEGKRVYYAIERTRNKGMKKNSKKEKEKESERLDRLEAENERSERTL
jgi:hypothetical protein